MPTRNLLVSASNEDAYESDANTAFSRTDPRILVRASPTDSVRFNSGMVFSNVAIPAGSTINTCTLGVYHRVGMDANIAADVYFNDVDDAANFEAEADVTDRAKTAASVSWVADGLGEGYASPGDLSVACQEVIDRPGWAAGQALCVLVEGKDQAALKQFQGDSYDYSSAIHPPQLDIAYSPPSVDAAMIRIGLGAVPGTLARVAARMLRQAGPAQVE